MTSDPATAPAPPAEAVAVFGAQLPAAERYAELLCGPGIERGLLGPREVPRIWERHLLNCAVVTDLLPEGARVVDVGSGAGLPGLALAIRRPDLAVVLVEPMARRTEFLREAVATLGLDGVRVLTGRIEDSAIRKQVRDEAFVTARAVSRLNQLALSCFPVLRDGGELLAVKGRNAAAEVDELPPGWRNRAIVVECGADVLAEPTTVVRLTKPTGQWVRA